MKSQNYWIKFDIDFFQRADVVMLEKTPNGKERVYLYIKLLCLSAKNYGYLMVNNNIPMNEKIIATITGYDIDFITESINYFFDYQLCKRLDNGTLYFNELQNVFTIEKMKNKRGKGREFEREIERDIDRDEMENENENENKLKEINFNNTYKESYTDNSDYMLSK